MQTINIVRGDSKKLKYHTINQSTNTQVDLVQGDRVVFMVKEFDCEKCNILIKKEITEFEEDGTCYIDLTPEDTNNIAAGQYNFDIKVYFKDDNIKTTIEDGIFIIKGDMACGC